jgi:hypothetical protein
LPLNFIDIFKKLSNKIIQKHNVIMDVIDNIVNACRQNALNEEVMALKTQLGDYNVVMEKVTPYSLYFDIV